MSIYDDEYEQNFKLVEYKAFVKSNFGGEDAIFDDLNGTLNNQHDGDVINDKLEYNSIPEWDSIAHMSLISELESQFKITFETDDIIDFSSFNKGKEILKKYKVEI